MKNLKKLLIPIGLIALVVGIFSFTNHNNGDDDKCKMKIVKIVNGIKTEVDSIFDCSDKMEWMSEIHGMGDSIHKMIKIMMIDGDSAEMDFKFEFDFDMTDENGMKVMKFKGDDGEEIEMNFDFKMSEGEGGSMKMMINGEEIEIKMEELHEHLGEMHENIEFIEEKEGKIEIMINTDEDGSEFQTIEIIKTIDDDGNVMVKKTVNGKEVEFDEADMESMHGGHNVMIIKSDGENSTMKEILEMVIDVNVDGKKGEKMKQIVIISKMTSSDKSSKDIPTPVDLNKKELGVEKLRFSPNPNDGKFELNFKLKDKKPVQVKVVDMQGKEVYNEKIKDFSGKYSNKIDISKNGEGIYILQILQGNKASTSRIVIK